MKTNRPNIIFYFSDQQRWDTVGCYGQKLDVTPNLDRLAAEGSKFENTFTCQPVCGPARACIQTGVYATQNGCIINGISLNTQAETLAKLFNQAGYDTAYIGKWHLASDNARGKNNFMHSAVPQERRGGYQYWMASDVLEVTSHGYNGYVFDSDENRVDFTGYRADCINDFAINYIHKHNDDMPFFMFLSQIEPHYQNDHGIYEGPDGSKEKFKDYEVPGDLVGTEGDWKENYPDYLGCCHSLDYNVGRLMDTLRDKGIADNTIVIYTSDHGSHFRTRNNEYKRSCHESSIHVPLIIWGGDFMGGKTYSQLVSLLDLSATVLDCAGIPVPKQFQGKSLLTLANGNSETEWRDHVFLQISESQVGRCIRTERWKYSVRADANGGRDSGSDVYYEDFLYDLKNDPNERNNLVDDPQFESVRKQLSVLLKQSMVQAEEKEPTILPFSQRVGNAVDTWPQR